jgi:hypothetical protein
MKKEQIARLLEHWSRPVPGSDVFRFAVVLVNNKADETMAALYQDSFTTVFSHPGDNTENGRVGVDTIPQEHQLPTLGDNPTDPASVDLERPWTPQIDPALLPPTPLDDPTDPGDPFNETQQPTPVIDPPPPTGEPVDTSPLKQSRPIRPKPKTRPKPKSPPALLPPTLGDDPTDPAIDPTLNQSGEPIDQLGSSVDVNLTNQQEQSRPNRPKPKARPKPKKPSTQDLNPSPNPISQQEEELGRPKRITKRKINVYLEAEEKDAQKKKQKKK